MAITVDAINTAAIKNLFSDTANTNITQALYREAINIALDEIHDKLVETNVDMYRFTGNTQAVTNGTAEYPFLATETKILGMFYRTGASPDFIYAVIPPFEDSRDNRSMAFWRNMFPFYNITGFNKYRWFESKQLLDDGNGGTGNWIRYYTIVPTPTEDFTLVKDGQRAVTSIALTGTDSSTYLDIPDNMFNSMTYRVMKYAYIRDTADLNEINLLIAQADSTAFAVHNRGMNKQLTNRVHRVR